MDTVVISILGAGFLGILGYFLQGLRADIRTLGTRLDGRIDRLEARFDARFDAMQVEHGRQFERWAALAERVATLEGDRS